MRWPRVRFTIWNLMIVVAAAAGLLVAARSPIGLFVAFGLAYLALIGVLWWIFHGFRRVSAACFGLVAALSNIATAGLCIHRLCMGGVFLMLLVWLLAFPLVFSAGAAWATTATRRETRSQRATFWAWPLVVASGILPLTMLLTPWPLRLAFLASAQGFGSPSQSCCRRAGDHQPGMGRVVPRSRHGSRSLQWQCRPDHRPGPIGSLWVRPSRRLPRAHTGRASGPLYNLYLDLKLSDEWRYECED